MKFIQSIIEVVQWIREANHSATLARNGKIKESQAAYR
jgi:hypothetical protein